jgi:hypothetical protein
MNMHWKVSQVSRAVRRYDPKLYAEMRDGRIDIFRRTYGHEAFDVDGHTILFIKEEPYRVFCLTDNWRAWGRPVDWGIEPIIQKLKSADLWQRDIGQDVINQNEKVDASKARHQKNEIEAFVKDYRREFARAFEDVNTSQMNKRNDRRFKQERKMKG